MSNLSDLESRAENALVAISQKLTAAQDNEKASALLAQQIDELTARSHQLREKLESAEASAARATVTAEGLTNELAEKETALSGVREELAAIDKLRSDHRTLQDTVSELRQKNTENIGDASLVNLSQEQDLKDMRAQRDSDLAEIDTILTKLTPLVEG